MCKNYEHEAKDVHSICITIFENKDKFCSRTMSKLIKENNPLTSFSSEGVILKLLFQVLSWQYFNDKTYLHHSSVDVCLLSAPFSDNIIMYPLRLAIRSKRMREIGQKSYHYD